MADFKEAEGLREKAKQARQEAEQKHQALLDAAREGEEAVIEEYETTNIGDAELTVKTQIPGKVMRQLDAIYDGDIQPGRMLDVYVDVLTAQTEKIEAAGYEWTSSADIRRFYQDWIDTNDAQAAAEIALERVIEEPNELEEQRKQEAMQSFRGAGPSRSNWARNTR